MLSINITNFLQGYFTTRVLLGCPAGQKVVFDSKLAKATRKHYCVDENPDVPCFHFERRKNLFISNIGLKSLNSCAAYDGI